MPVTGDSAAHNPKGTPPVVCLLGGESTGKSTLAQALQDHLEHAHGLRVLLVPEVLRAWCTAAGRAPQAFEQAAIAAEQSRRIRDASQQDGIDLVIADTSALVVASYSELYFADTSLLTHARDEQSRYALHLLMGLDPPWTPDGLFRDGASVRDKTDALLRRELDAAGLPYQTIYGQQEVRLQAALRAVGRWLGRDLLPTDREHTQGRVAWHCENCSDPDCERRLFSGLVGKPGV